MKRTEEEKLTQSSIAVILGGKKHYIKPLVIRDSREWRQKVSAVLVSLPGYTRVTTDDLDLFEKALKAMLVEMPDKVIDLFFDYAKDLDKEEIEAVATDSEMAKAFEKVVEMAFPLAGSLVGAMGTLSR